MLLDILFVVIGAIFGWLAFPFILSLFAKWNKEATAQFVFDKIFKRVFTSEAQADSVSNTLAAEAIEFLAHVIKQGPDTPEIETCANIILENAIKVKRLSLNN